MKYIEQLSNFWSNLTKLGKSAVIAVAVLLAFFVFIRPMFSTVVETLIPTVVEPPVVTVDVATMSDLKAQVPISGTLKGENEVSVFPEVSGFIVKEILVDEGAFVHAGDVLAKLDTVKLTTQRDQATQDVIQANANVDQAQSQLISAEAALSESNATLDRDRKLRNAGVIAQVTLDQAVVANESSRANRQAADSSLQLAKAQLDQAKSRQDTAERDLANANIKAPIMGIVSQKNIENGSVSSAAGNPAFVIIDDGKVELSVDVIETAINTIEVGDFTVIDVPGVGEINGSVRHVASSVDPTTRLGEVEISLDSEASFRSGIYASGLITTEIWKAISVPITAVLTDTNGDYVRLVDEAGAVSTARVVAGSIWDGRREIISGLTDGQTVIAKSGAFYNDGDVVKPLAAPTQEAK